MVPQVTHTRASGYLARRSLTHSAGGGALRRCRGRGASMSSSAASASVAGSRDSSSATVAPSGGELPDSVCCVSVLMFCSLFAPLMGRLVLVHGRLQWGLTTFERMYLTSP